MTVSNTTMMLIKVEAMRLIELMDALTIDDDGSLNYWRNDNRMIIAEFKQKARELRRDTISLEKQIRG